MGTPGQDGGGPGLGGCCEAGVTKMCERVWARTTPDSYSRAKRAKPNRARQTQRGSAPATGLEMCVQFSPTGEISDISIHEGRALTDKSLAWILGVQNARRVVEALKCFRKP